ncbi:MAG: PTS cellobiose transporter subunit IIC, partial [Limisphaerales bacterium]
MSQTPSKLERYLVAPLNRLSENPYLAAIRAGMVAVVPLTIIGGLFMVFAYLPMPGWEDWLKARGWLSLLEL